MKILLIAGHGAGDTGALGNGYKEADLTRELTRLVCESLNDYDVQVDVYNFAKNAYQDVQNGVFKVGHYDYAIEFHFNWDDNPQAHGTECFVTDVEAEITVEQDIMKDLSEFYTLRDNDKVFDGVKRKNFSVITSLKNMGISACLLELCFISNKKDMIVYQSHKREIADTIADSVAEMFVLKRKARQLTNTHVVKFMNQEKKVFYLNVYEKDTLEKTGSQGYYDKILTIGTEGARNLFEAWSKQHKVAEGASKGTMKKGTKLLCKVVATTKRKK